MLSHGIGSQSSLHSEGVAACAKQIFLPAHSYHMMLFNFLFTSNEQLFLWAKKEMMK